MTSLPKKTNDSKIVDIIGFFLSLPTEDQIQVLDILVKALEKEKEK
tara:strand:+ start:15236 stop:15373 length:138 start_codon:yes stop_codon:yes gene_type:complete